MTYPGATINNRYRIERKIAEGGFAQVFLATDLILGRNVAIKTMDAYLISNPELLARFQREARAVAALDHPNILTVHDFGLLPDAAYLVMPFVPGGPLSARMRAARLTLDEAGVYLEQIATALDYSHANGIIHRDVKPQNILLRADGRLVLTDFGFAKLLADASPLTRQGILGTVQYMSPEQFGGQVGPATDQYALGVLLYQMVSNALPFTGSPQDMAMGHLHHPPPRLAQHPAMQGVPLPVLTALDEVLTRVLAKAAAARYSDCMALYKAYRAALGAKASPAVFPGGQDEDEKTELAPARKVPRPLETAPADAEQTSWVPPAAVPASQAGGRPVEAGPGRNPAVPRSPVLVRPARLTVRTEPDQRINLAFDLNAETLTLGRELNNDLQIPLSTVSRHHATLYRVGAAGPGQKYRLVDNKSRNQLIYQDRIITERVLEDGDIIEIGKRGFGEYVVILTYYAPVFR